MPESFTFSIWEFHLVVRVGAERVIGSRVIDFLMNKI